MHDDDDEFDDFSHLPSVDDLASAEEKKALWRQHSRNPAGAVPESEPEHSALVEEVLEEQLPAHELPVEQEFSAEEHPSHAPEWAEEAFMTGQAPAVEEIPIEPPGEVQDWVREAFELSAEAPVKKKKRRDPELHLPAKTAPEDAPVAEKKPPADDIKIALGGADSARPEKKETPPETKTEAAPGTDKKEKTGDESDGKKQSDAPHHPGPPLIPHVEERELTRKERFQKSWEKIGGRALAGSVIAHIGLLIIAAMVYITTTTEKEVDFLPGGGSKGANEAAQSLQHKVQQKKNTWLKNKPLRRVVSTNISPNLTLPEVPPDMDFPDATQLIGSKNMSGGGFGSSGIGKGFGAGMGFGGKINFMGNTGVGRNIVFVVDVSASMSAKGDSGTGKRISRFDLLKNELARTIGRLPPNTQYQVLFFSDFAWPHNEVDSKNLEAFDKYAWTISPDKTGARVPTFRYLTAAGPTVARSIEIIREADNPGGTNWGSGLFMALKAFPKPDVVFFMTDGNKSDAVGWLDAVTKLNLTGGKRSVIHTTAMMEPDAAEELDQLAKRNGGNFTIVTATGFTLTSDEFFKGQK